MSALLSIRDLHVRYRVGSGLAAFLGFGAETEAVAGVSLDIEEGRTLAVVGESGSGKTTLAKAVNGLVPVSAGSIRFRGTEIAGLSEAAFLSHRRRMAMMFQDPVGSLSPRLTVRGLIAQPFLVHGLGDRDIDAECRRLLGLVGLAPEFAERYPHQLSGGQARRIGVARALALDPGLLIADEPTAGLDVSVQGEILNLMNEVQDRLGVAFLLITHNLNIVRHVAHRTAIMYSGRMVEEGRTDAVFARPAHPYTQALLASNLAAGGQKPGTPVAAPRLGGDAPNPRTRPRGCSFHTHCPIAEDRCARDAPALREVEADHAAACLLRAPEPVCHGRDREP